MVQTIYVISGSNQINPWGFIEKTLNMLTDTDTRKYSNIKESKPLRHKLKLVMIKIIEKLWNTLREQQSTWDIEKLKSDSTKQYGGKLNDTIFDLATQLAQIATWNETVALKIEKDVLDQLSEDFIENKLQNNSTLLKIKDHLENKPNHYPNQTTTCQNGMECLTNLKKYHTLIQLPFEVLNLGNLVEFVFLQLRWVILGFGTYLAYFSRLLSKPAWNKSFENRFLMNEEMTAEEKEIRQYMNLVLTNLTQGQQLANISIWELAKYLHVNPDDIQSQSNAKQSQFSRPLQNDFGCWLPKYWHFLKAWKYYSKAYFAD